MDLKVSIVASTKEGHVIPMEGALAFGSKAANICYTESPFNDIQGEDSKKNRSRMERLLDNGHHSVYGHVNLSLYIEGLPKILAMILNNEKAYTTSEKSARYTKMELSPIEKELYDKWMKIFMDKIEEVYPEMDSRDKNKREKLAQENARYLTSVFTPTKMLYTLEFRQLNYIMHFFKDFIENATDDDFNIKLKEFMKQFNQKMEGYYVERLSPDIKLRKLSLFASRGNFKEEFGENYSVSYESSFAYLAQAHRHRTISYQIVKFADGFFVPPIILEDSKLVGEWNGDMESVKDLYPQGSLLLINERGIYENFISKAAERLCGQVQLETMKRTKNTLERFINTTRITNPAVHEELVKLSDKSRCILLKDYHCKSGCVFGPDRALDRLV